MPSVKAKYIIILMLIIALGLILSIKTVLGSGMFLDLWDDYYYIYFSHLAISSGFSSMPLGNFATEYILISVPAIFYKFFGISTFTTGLFSMLCLIGTVISVFLISKLLRNEVAGIFSALTFVLVPLVAAEGAASGDNMQVTFFATLAVLLLLFGEKKRKASYYALSGFIGFIGLLAGSALNLTIFLFLVPYLLYLLFKERNQHQFRFTLLFFAGIFVAIAVIMLLGTVLQSKPLIYFITNFSSYPASSTQNFLDYVSLIFPHYDINNISLGFFAWPLIKSFGNDILINVLGLFGYAMLVCFIYLIAKRQYNVLIPFSWFGILLLYLSFGRDSFYGGYIIFAARFSIILVPAMAIIIGLAFESLAGAAFKEGKASTHRKKRVLYKIALSIAVLLYVIVVINALLLMKFIHISNAVTTYQWTQVAKKLLSLPQNTTIYIVSGLSASPGVNASGHVRVGGFPNASLYISDKNFLNWMAIEGCGGYTINANFSAIFSNCSAIKGNYIVVVNDTPYKNNLPLCNNVDLYFTPQLNASVALWANDAWILALWANNTWIYGGRAQISIYKVI